MQNLGLSGRYKDDDAFNRLVRRATALPLVPREQVDDVWMEALNEVNDEESTRFTDYMTSTWIDRVTAKFPIELWSQDENIDGIRTNNHLEGWHSTLNKAMSRPHPNIFMFVEMLKSEQRKYGLLACFILFLSFRLIPINGRHSGDNRTEDIWQCFTPDALPAATYW